MKTKAEIVQRLIEKKEIDAEEAVILLMQEKEIQFIPYNPQPYIPAMPANPVYPNPFGPFYTGNPWPVMSHGTIN